MYSHMRHFIWLHKAKLSTKSDFTEPLSPRCPCQTPRLGLRLSEYNGTTCPSQKSHIGTSLMVQ